MYPLNKGFDRLNPRFTYAIKQPKGVNVSSKHTVESWQGFMKWISFDVELKKTWQVQGTL
jgi:hypothetical protein